MPDVIYTFTGWGGAERLERLVGGKSIISCPDQQLNKQLTMTISSLKSSASDCYDINRLWNSEEMMPGLYLPFLINGSRVCMLQMYLTVVNKQKQPIKKPLAVLETCCTIKPQH